MNLILIVLAAVLMLILGLRIISRKIERKGHLIGGQKWAIGIYEGKNPLSTNPSMRAKNPVMTAEKVTDVPAAFTADPFMIQESGKWYMFFEVLNTDVALGQIGLASSEDGFDWKYEKIVLKERSHLSFPFVFKDRENFYMLPESFQEQEVRLYQAEEFPYQWKFVKTLICGDYFVDPQLFQHDGLWWLFVSNHHNKDMFIYYANDFLGEWNAHRLNPVIQNDLTKARGGGPVLQWRNRLIRFGQVDNPIYGEKVRAFEIKKLTKDEYEEQEIKESPVLQKGVEDWNAGGMHQYCPVISGDVCIASVDGFRSYEKEELLTAKQNFKENFIRRAMRGEKKICVG